MKLFLITQQGFGVQSFSVVGPGAMVLPDVLFTDDEGVLLTDDEGDLLLYTQESVEYSTQVFLVTEGQGLLTIDMIVDMGGRPLKYSNGPETVRPTRSAEVEKALRDWD